MQNRPSQDPRDAIRRSAMNDAAAIAAMLADEYEATYQGPDREAYLAALATWLGDLEGRVIDGPAVQFPTRRIAIRFGPVSGHR
jgi:hypothetical protein